MSKTDKPEVAKPERAEADPKLGIPQAVAELKDSDLDQVSGGATRGGVTHSDLLFGCGGGSG